jgi:hypothetical protein
MARFSHLNDVFIVKETDEKGTFTLAEAKALCTTLKEGWRVPTLSELETVYNECMDQGIQKLTGDLKFKTENYLTDTVDEFDGWPLSFDFNDGISYLSSEKSKHLLRLVRNETEPIQEVNHQDFINNTILVLQKYVPNLNEVKFNQFMNSCLFGDPELDDSFGEQEPVKLNNIRYVTLEDDNMCSFPEDFYLAHFHEDNDTVMIWEDDYYAAGYNQDELDDEEEGLRDGFIGFIDLIEKKYLRINGYGMVIEYGTENPEVPYPDWNSWC